MGRPRPADLRPRPMAFISVGAGEASEAAEYGAFRAVASSWVGAAYQEEAEVEKATATLRELEATAGPEPSWRNASRDADLDANAIVRMLVTRMLMVSGQRRDGSSRDQTSCFPAKTISSQMDENLTCDRSRSSPSRANSNSRGYAQSDVLEESRCAALPKVLLSCATLSHCHTNDHITSQLSHDRSKAEL